jgi:5-methylcytosine-specific restriction protein A
VLPDAVAADLEALVIDRPVVDDVKASAGAPNPDWTRDELILALDLYFREPSARGSKAHRECIRLSEILNALPIHAKASHGTTFRNPNGVAMKLSNFLKYDPSYSGKGLSAGSQAEQEVWDTFASDHAKLRGTADAILAAAEFLKGEGISSGDDGDDEGAEEGRILYKLHRYRERAGSLPSKKKKAAMRERGALECEACGFDFAETYGDRGQGYAECHHGRPLSKLIPGEKTRLADLHIVCANCHRMIHFGKRWLTVAEVKALRSSPSAPHSKEH